MFALVRFDALQALAQRLRLTVPGVAFGGVLALAATFVATLQGGPPMLYALLFGTVFNYQGLDPRTSPGVELCARTVLRLGVGLLGARITAAQVAALGWPTALGLVVAVVGTLGCGLFVARRLGLSFSLGMLAGGATAICGAAAALAIAAVLPRDKSLESNTLAVVVTATLLSTAAMLFYPLVTRWIGLSPGQAGVFIGATIHDVAQVVVAGYAIGPEAGDVASIVKLSRVAMLVVVVLGVSIVCRRQYPADAQRARPPMVPGFLLLFLALVALNSLGWLSADVRSAIGSGSRVCLMVGVAALGMKTSLGHLARTGWRPLALMVVTTIWLALFVLVALWVQRGVW